MSLIKNTRYNETKNITIIQIYLQKNSAVQHLNENV